MFCDQFDKSFFWFFKANDVFHSNDVRAFCDNFHEWIIYLIFYLTGLSTTASSSLSSGELLETPPRAPSSPSAASLQLKPEPLSVEMGGKSSSAPLLENNDVEKTNGKVPVGS